jgi:putative transposase
MLNPISQDDDFSIEVVDLSANPTAARPESSAEVQRLQERLLAVQRQLWAAQAKVMEPGTVRLVGRVAAVKLSKNGTQAMVTLVMADEGDRYQSLRIRAQVADVANVWIGAEVMLTVTWQYGRLALVEIEDLREVVEAMPELPTVEKPKAESRVPDWFDSKAANEARDLLKANDGSSSVSDLRIHLVWATKRRGKILTAAMVDRLKALVAEVVKSKRLGRLLACNGEADHVHVALWLPANLSGSEAMGVIKSYTSRFLRREFPELKGHDEDALWQRGGFVGSIGNGGDLSTVLAYIANQDSPAE